MAARKYSIVDGPGKWDFVVGLFERDRHFHFTIHGKRPKDVLVIDLRSASMEDGSKNRWLITGYVVDYGVTFKGYYDIQTRKGWIEFQAP